jgi:hypothetical protein
LKQGIEWLNGYESPWTLRQRIKDWLEELDSFEGMDCYRA